MLGTKLEAGEAGAGTAERREMAGRDATLACLWGFCTEVSDG
jgi:hypothetical protein